MWHDVITWCIACSQPAGRPKHDLLAKQSWLLEEHPLYTWEYFCQHEIGWTFFLGKTLWLDLTVLGSASASGSAFIHYCQLRRRIKISWDLRLTLGLDLWFRFHFRFWLRFALSKGDGVLWLDCELLRSKVNPIVTVVLQHRRRGIHLIEKQVGI